jgi:molybdopterin biosynthesis enzyme MoaB
MRSASVPETIEAVVAQNTIWKNQSEARVVALVGGTGIRPA